MEKKLIRLTEQDLNRMIMETLDRVLKESGENHRFGQGKYGLAMDAAAKARKLGRIKQADNLVQHGSDAFNKEYGTGDFQMDDFGTLNYRGKNNDRMMYRPKSRMDKFKKLGTKNDFERAELHNAEIDNAASTAKAFPRKKMQSGLDAIDAVDAGINGYEAPKSRR